MQKFEFIAKLCNLAVLDLSESLVELRFKPVGVAKNDSGREDSVIICVAARGMLKTKEPLSWFVAMARNFRESVGVVLLSATVPSLFLSEELDD